jgi:hypothetical protein
MRVTVRVRVRVRDRVRVRVRDRVSTGALIDASSLPVKASPGASALPVPPLGAAAPG